MTLVPLPASPCLRVRLDYEAVSEQLAGSRFYLSYAGTGPSGTDCTTIASDIETAWTANIAPLICTNFSLREVDVIDIATRDGLSGQWSGTSAGTRAGNFLPLQVATNVEFGIGRRYRGGKPRMFLPSGVESDLADQAHYNNAFLGDVNGGIAAFFAAIEALAVGAVGALAHVSLSYYFRFTNVVNSSGREHAVPTYRDAAVVDPVIGYSCKAMLGSQRRRRSATTY